MLTQRQPEEDYSRTVFFGLVAPSAARACSVEIFTAAAMVTVPTSVVATLVVPAVAVAADPSLNYGGGVGWTAVGAASMGLSATPILGDTCPAFYMPGVMSLAGAIMSTTVWAVASQDTNPNPPFAVSIAPTTNGDGAMVTVGGRF